jgi:PAS domain S-box-containing protein
MDAAPADLNILIIEDSIDDAELARRELLRLDRPLELLRIESADGLYEALGMRRWDLVLCDHGLPRFSIFEALEIITPHVEEAPFIILSGTIGEEATVRALKAGAADVVLKQNISRLPAVVERELRSADERRIHKKAQRDLLESEARKTAILESVVDAIVTIDEQGAVVEVNRAAERIFGRDRASVLGQQMPELFIPPDLRSDHRAGFARYLGTGESSILDRRVKVRAMRKEGDEFPVELTVVAIDQPGQQMFTASIRDITDQERLERELQQAQRLESLGRLAGGVAHDFNNLLSVIVNYAQFLAPVVQDDVQAAEDLAAIVHAADQASQLTRQLLTFGRRDVVHPRVVDLDGIVHEVGRLLQRTIGADLDLVITSEPTLEPVWADPGQMEQVVMNLSLNARDAMPEGGRLVLRTSNVLLDEVAAGRFTELGPGRFVLLEVIDGGTGMDPDTVARVFEPFFTTKPTGQGTGLGLATCYGIVRGAGGEIVIDSEVGRGTTVAVYLPASDGSASDAATPTGPPAASGAPER